MNCADGRCAVYKKQFLARPFDHLDNGAYAQALLACDRLLGQDSGFLMDLLRCKGEILNVLGLSPAEAQAVYQQVLAQRVLPWARMGLAVACRTSSSC